VQLGALRLAAASTGCRAAGKHGEHDRKYEKDRLHSNSFDCGCAGSLAGFFKSQQGACQSDGVQRAGNLTT
jgi:hypothetical protein